MKELPQNVSESTRKRNPHLYSEHLKSQGWSQYGEQWHRIGVNPSQVIETLPKELHPPKPPKRIRQSTKPLMNKLEQRYLGYLRMLYVDHPIISQGMKFRLANGCWYCPDFVVWGDENSDTRAFEVKGRQPLQDDSVVKIKIAAKEYYWMRWYLVWWENNKWSNQLVLP